MASLAPDLRSAIADLVNDLVAGRYADIEADGRAGRVTAGEIEEAIRHYGRTLIPLPAEAWDLVDVYENRHDPKALALDVDLFTKEEGRSDLTLSIAAIQVDRGWNIGINDLHVQ